MSNVLGTLFGDIAEAIRGKTGETGTMKPAEFPDKIAGISVGGSGSAGGSVDGSGWLVASGQIDSDTGRPVIIEHGLGVVPDIVQVAVGVWGPMSDASYFAYPHTYDANGVCTNCGHECRHWFCGTGNCSTCGIPCPHKIVTDGVCVYCGENVG